MSSFLSKATLLVLFILTPLPNKNGFLATGLSSPTSIESRTSTSPITVDRSVHPNTRMFLDTAVESEWDKLLPLGIFHGVTTNPTLLERANQPCTVSNLHAMAKRVLRKYNCQEFMCQAWGTTSEQLYDVGMKLSCLDLDDDDVNDESKTRLLEPNKRMVIKVPVTVEGTKAASMLIQSGVRVCLTACYASHQALVATAVGAEYLAPYLGRMNDAGKNGMKEIKTMQQIAETCCSKYSPGNSKRTRIFVASIRDVESMVKLAVDGLDTFTFSPDIARALFMEPLTEQATHDFELAAQRNGAGAFKLLVM